MWIPEKFRKERDRDLVEMLSKLWLPKRVLTPLGAKQWLVRNNLIATGLLSVMLNFACR